jgi:hypothetical protein
VGQPHERVKGVVCKAGILASGEHPKLLHVVLVTGRARADVIANKPQTVADVKLQSPVSPDKVAGREWPAITGSRFAELKLEAVWRKNLCNRRDTCPESSFRSIFRPTPKQFHNVLARWRDSPTYSLARCYTGRLRDVSVHYTFNRTALKG